MDNAWSQLIIAFAGSLPTLIAAMSALILAWAAYLKGVAGAKMLADNTRLTEQVRVAAMLAGVKAENSASQIKEQVNGLLEEKIKSAYLRGHADGKAGLPPKQ